MGLTSRTFIALLVLLAVVVVAAVLWLWPKVAGSGPFAWLGRFGMLTAVVVTVVFALLVWGNQNYGIYTSWGDILGRGAGKQTIDTAQSSGHAIPELIVQGQEGGGLPGGRTKYGQIDRVHINGLRSGLQTDGFVYLPARYFQKGHGKDRFPAVVAITGYPGDARNLITKVEIPRTAAAEIAAKRIKPVIVVMVRPSLVPGRDTECTDAPGSGPKAETFFSQDLTLAVSSQYRTAEAPYGWAAMGDSTGGYCALKLAMRDSDRFIAAASMSGDYDAKLDKSTGDLYGKSAQVRHENDLMWRLDHLTQPPVGLLLATSKNEPNYQPTLRFVSKIRPPMRVTTLVRETGAHAFNTWQAEVPAILHWMSGMLTADGRPPA